MHSTSGLLPVASIFRNLAAAPHDGRDRHQAARQLAGLDPKRFLSNLQAAAMSRSPQAISALTADMRELEDIFHKLARAGHDVSAAQRDYQVLKQFISQLTSTSNRDQQQQPRSYPAPAHPNQAHHRSNSFPPPSSRHHHEVHPSYQPHPQYGSGPASHQHYSHSYTPSSSSSPPSKAQYDSRSSLPPQGFAQGGISPTSSLRTSSSSSRSSSQSSHYSQVPSPPAEAIPHEIVSPVPNRLVKPRRMSAPAVASAKEVKRVHFARHATVYTFSTDVKGTYRVSNNETNAPFPPARPSCVPRVDGSHTSESRPRF